MNFKRMMNRLIHQQSGNKNSGIYKFLFPFIGILAVIWILIRVIPKPSRATYPCMKMAFPLATSFALYISGLSASVFLFRKAGINIRKRKFLFSSVLFLLAFTAGIIALANEQKTAQASVTDSYNYIDPLGPNKPIGEAKGIFPGRVVWVHNPDATNEKCKSKTIGDGYFLDKNCDQTEVDKMLREAMITLTGKETETAAWDATFRFFNKNHGKGDVGYSPGETIFIKINAVHAWTVNKDLSIKSDENYGNVDTSPQAVLAMLRQLVNKAGVPQQNIYIGDPFTNIFKHCYDKWSAEFPNIHYITKYKSTNRYQITPSTKGQIVYSDKGTVLDEKSDAYYNCHIDAAYILNIPALKGHRWGGVTFFAKNHFGSHTRGSSSHLHPGLHRIDYDKPLREEYKQYRVMVDLMGHEQLGGKTLIYFGDFLWGTSYEHDPPMRFRSAPFNNDWSSSILLSFDPVAIETVALDIYQSEIKEEDLTSNPPRYAYVRFRAIDDYLHQAASKDWWPAGITYDPEGDGTPIGSLGVHEHWNNDTDKQYSRNLGTGDGIELKMISQSKTVSAPLFNAQNAFQIRCFPNQVKMQTSIELVGNFQGKVKLTVFDTSGKKHKEFSIEKSSETFTSLVDLSDLTAGIYILKADIPNKSSASVKIVKQ